MSCDTRGMTGGIKDQRGATAVEYGLIAALCALTLIAALAGVGEALEIVFEQQTENLSD